MTTYSEWIAQRCGKITASEIYKIMGKGRNANAYFSQVGESYLLSKVAEILTIVPNNGGRLNTNAMDWGITEEPDAIAAFELLHPHFKVNYFGVMNPKFFEYNAMCGGSPDAIFEAATGDAGIIEAKCPYNSTEHVKHLRIVDNTSLYEIAPEYYWQMVANMLFTETHIGYFISYDKRMVQDKLRLHIVPIEPIDGHLDLLRKRIDEAVKWIKTEVGIITDEF